VANNAWEPVISPIVVKLGIKRVMRGVEPQALPLATAILVGLIGVPGRPPGEPVPGAGVGVEGAEDGAGDVDAVACGCCGRVAAVEGVVHGDGEGAAVAGHQVDHLLAGVRESKEGQYEASHISG